MQKVTLINNGVTVRTFFVAAFLAAQNKVVKHLAQDRGHRATITDELTGDLRVYSWIGDRLDISVF